MRILLTVLDQAIPPLTGASAYARRLAERLAQAGHQVRIFCLVHDLPEDTHPPALGQSLRALRRLGVPIAEPDDGFVRFSVNGVEHAGVRNAPPRALLAYGNLIEHFAPDRIVVSDGYGTLFRNLLRLSFAVEAENVTYIAHMVNHLPDGPLTAHFDPGLGALIRRVGHCVAVSEFARAYLDEAMGIDATVLYPELDPPEPAADNPLARPFVGLINASLWKGLPLFLSLAERVPEARFLAVAGWGTTEADLDSMRRHPNVHVLPWQDDLRTVYAKTKVVLMPSLWHETFGIACVEAMARGIPVLASEVGGLPEAKLGIDGLLPVKPLHFERGWDPRFPPQPEPQDLPAWEDALRRLLEDEAHYQAQSAASRRAAKAFIAAHQFGPIDRTLPFMAQP